MDKEKINIGATGEDVACRFLITRGYIIVARNFWRPWGEIDLVAIAPDKTLVFIEVKTMMRKRHKLTPEDNLTFAKAIKLKRICNFYANENHYLVNEEKGWRIDLMAVELDTGGREGSGLTDGTKDYGIRHYENI